MTDHLRALCDQHGIFLRREALALGYHDRALARSLRQHQIHRVRHGSYVFTDQWERLDEAGRHLVRAMAVRRTAQTGVALSHVSALALLGVPMWDLPLDQVHVTRLDGRAGRKEAGVSQHQGLLLPGDVVETDGVSCTSPTRTALDLTTIADVEHSLPVVEHLLHHGMTSRGQLTAGARQMTHWPGTLGTDLTIRLADGRHESIGESRAHYLLWRGGLPIPEPQFEIINAQGVLVARVDFAWPEFGVFMEFDGRVKYEGLRREGESVVDVVLREKRREEMICRITGWRCLRIVWRDLHHPDTTIRHIRAVLAGAPVH